MRMTQQENAQHWMAGAHDALKAAKLLHTNGQFALCLFHAHLAVEKGLKAMIILKEDTTPPKSHNLTLLAERMGSDWSDDDRGAFDELSVYATAARYEEVEWQEKKATKENAGHWLKKAEEFVSHFSSLMS